MHSGNLLIKKKNEFNPISTKEIYNLFEDSVAKYSKVDRDENAAQIVFKNALYGIICDFTKKKKSIFKKRVICIFILEFR